MPARALGEVPSRSPFLVGLSAAGYRCEGSFNGPDQPMNQWAAWERAGALTQPTGGCDLWRHPEPAIELAAAAGVQVLAVGLEWARVEPAPGHVDDDALTRYAEILDLAARHGLVPVVTLHDVAHPHWLGEEFWLTPGAPDRFAEHARRTVARLGASCRHWVTVRQPNHVALCGWVTGAHPPRRLGALSDAWAVLDNLSSAHVLAYDEIHRVQPDATVAMGVRRAPSYDAHRLALDLVCAPQLGVERAAVDAWVDDRRARHDMAVPAGDLAQLAWRRVAGRTSPFGRRARTLRRASPRRLLDVVYARPSTTAPLDAVWLVWRPRPEPTSPERDLAEDAVALSTWCTSQRVLGPDVPLWIEDGIGPPPGAQGAAERASHLEGSLRAVSEARAAGSPVAAYVYHSLGPDADLVLPPPPWTPRFLPRALHAPTVAPTSGSTGAVPARTTGDFGLFDVVASPGDTPQWRQRAGDALARLADAARASTRAHVDTATADETATADAAADETADVAATPDE